jgi:dolichol-phosphate mannosyltransferase
VGREVQRIYVVDDACPCSTGAHVEANCSDPRVLVIRNRVNLGVGGATLAGYRAALNDGASILVKIDADAQMDPSLIPFFVQPIIRGEADYTKGNRFFNAASLADMPRSRVAGNAGLSFLAKLSTGYWGVFDPTNGYTAIEAKIADLLPFERISKRFFFETDVLFYLSLLRAVVLDIPLMAHYGSERSNLKERAVFLPFLGLHLVRFLRRVVLNYFIRDFSLASISLLFGTLLLTVGVSVGLSNWLVHMVQGVPTPVGTIMLAVLLVLLGTQFVLFFFAADIAAVPTRPLHTRLHERSWRPLEQFRRHQQGSRRENG